MVPFRKLLRKSDPLRNSARSAASTISDHVSDVPMIAVTPDLAHSRLFLHSNDRLVSRYSTRSTVVLSGSAPIASLVIFTVIQASRTTGSSDSLDSILSLMDLMKKISRDSTGSNAPTPSAPIDDLPAFIGPDNRVMRVLVGADSLDSVHSPFFTRHSSGSTASISSSAISPPVSCHQYSGASRSVDYADSQVSVHTISFIHQSVARKSTRSTVSTYSSPISPPVVVNQASGASRAVTLTEFMDLVQLRFFIQLDRFWFSLGCSIDRSKAASMVIAHKVGRYDGEILVDNPWMDLKSKLMLIYGSIWRPPEICSSTSSWHISVELVCVCFTHSIFRYLGSGNAYCGVAYKLWKVLEASLRHHSVSRQREQWLANITQHFECDFARHGLAICADDCFASLRFVFLLCEHGLMMMLHKAVLKPPISQGELLLSTPICNLLTPFSAATKLKRFKLELVKDFGLVICRHLFNLKLLLQQILPQVLLQRQSLYYGFIDHMLLARSGWFMFMLEFLYCSLPRPPEEHYAFSSNSH